MSIFEMLDRLEGEGELVRYLPSGLPMSRSLYLTSRLYDLLRDTSSSFHFFGQISDIGAAFDVWVSGSLVSIRLSGTNSNAYLARLEPPPEEIWEIRVTAPSPQVRIFARFAAQDVLIATAAVNRDYLGNAFSRGRKRSKAWMEAMHDCQSEWSRLLGGTAAFRGGGVRDYVSENCVQSR